METLKIDCIHACRNTCSMLNELMKRETATLTLMEGIYAECNYPEVKSFILEKIEAKRKEVVEMITKLKDIQERSVILDGMMESFGD